MKYIVCNAFSINMLPRAGHTLEFVPCRREAIICLLANEEAVECAIGHEDTARLVATDLGLDDEKVEEWVAIAQTRPTVTFDPATTSLIVAQYRGPRLPAGATSLPEGATIEYWQVYSY